MLGFRRFLEIWFPLTTSALAIGTLLTTLLPVAPTMAARAGGQLTIRVIDRETGQPIAASMQLRNGRGRPVRVRAEGIVSGDDYFVFDGQVTLQLRKGTYQFLIEAGPEYQTRPGHFTMDRGAEDSTEVAMQRRVDMQAEGWWAGDLDVRQRAQDLPLLMRAARVDFTAALRCENVRGKCRKETAPVAQPRETIGSLDFRRGGGLIFLSSSYIDVCDGKADGSSLPLIRENRDTDIVALTPFAWDLPLWVAEGKLDAIQIIHRHALSNDVVDNEGWSRKRDRTFFPGKTGNGRWSEAIYHHLLNCGIQIAPAAGSGSGTNKSPIGTNRVYVYCGESYSPQDWRMGLRKGHVMVTNGPLLRTQVSGHPPGHQFDLDASESRDFQIGLGLAFYEKAPVEYLEIVKNGQVAHEIRLDQLAQRQGRLPPLRFDESGWFLVRAMTSTTQNYQFASTAPYYVQVNQQLRISRKSVQFFLDWLDQAAAQFADNRGVLTDIAAARPFWEERLRNATVD